MKKISYLFIIGATLISSCVGKHAPELPPAPPTLQCDLPHINIDNGESATLRVKLNAEVVSDAAEITISHDSGTAEPFSGTVFTPTEAGDYTFTATYQGSEPSHILTIKAVKADDLSTDFFRRHLVMKFTATWCANCPEMGETIEELSEEMPMRISEMAIHCMESGKAKAALEAAESSAYAKELGFETLPYAYINTDGYTTSRSITELKGLITAAESKSGSAAGVTISNTRSGKNLDIKVEITAVDAADYKLGVAIVQDNYQFSQTGTDNTNYKQNHVTRQYVAGVSGSESFTLTAGETKSMDFSTTLEDKALQDESRVIAYLLKKTSDGTYVVNNVAECCTDSSIGYIYELK